MGARMVSWCNSGVLHASFSCSLHSTALLTSRSRINQRWVGSDKRTQNHHNQYGCPERKTSKGRLIVVGATEGSSKSSKAEESMPSWARPDTDEPPPWARDEQPKGGLSSSDPTLEIPFFAYLLASAITAIAAIGSIFEYANQKPVFGILGPDSIFYAPLLGFFVFTGFPSSAFLWFKSVQAANKEAEEQDRRDGYF
ncbi:hypothetical protein Tsubulata_008383 [Turnera subulata]|uniref:Uncharacterized protein n=1 Tax=Turnera subulata TaxID=218843 RepID=A0A9Q0J714_9ROSI|nr:hypothetical protein Tsubulata_008383 [Turnera subulata]